MAETIRGLKVWKPGISVNREYGNLIVSLATKVQIKD